VQDENYLCELLGVKLFFDYSVAVPNVFGCVVEVALNEALENIEEDAVSGDVS
jgi:hypothetical protein